jgi:acyl-coenzyme A thioesterase PaaI-like protein
VSHNPSGPPIDAVHPILIGRVDGSAALADAVRRLIELCTATTAPDALTLAAARELEAIADALERHVPDPLPGKTWLPEVQRTDLAASMATRTPFDLMVGRHSPLAPPLTVSFIGKRAVLTGSFSRPYEGPPGCVHGGALAASFDLACSAANFVAGVQGPTVRLDITYRRPTALNTPCTFEAEVEELDGSRVRTVGRLVQDGQVTVEAVGVFAVMSREDLERLLERAKTAASPQ